MAGPPTAMSTRVLNRAGSELSEQYEMTAQYIHISSDIRIRADKLNLASGKKFGGTISQ